MNSIGRYDLMASNGGGGYGLMNSIGRYELMNSIGDMG